MLAKLQQFFVRFAKQADDRATVQDMRQLAIGAAKVTKNLSEGEEATRGLLAIEQAHLAETSNWVEPSEIEAGRGGAFDACDLRIWLALAARAGVAHVPAREILRLTEDEMGELSGALELPSTPATRRLGNALSAIASKVDFGHLLAGPTFTADEREALIDRLYNAMDHVPEGWMVRSHRCGGSELKALAGLGYVGDTSPEVRFGTDIEIGPGWVRDGNRRRVHISDRRTLQAAASGAGFMSFLARPWEPCSRYLITEDPHRHGTPFAGKGRWPAEWRAIVEDGHVVGVSSYYGWADTATPETAAIALEVRSLAQKIVDEAVRLQAHPRYPELELIRGASWLSEHPDFAHALDTRFGRKSVSCTLDFIETPEGLKLLEGGPAVTPMPVGGGHPCAWAGAGITAEAFRMAEIDGVAFRTMDHVLIADPKTWHDGDRTGCVLSWDAVHDLAGIDIQ